MKATIVCIQRIYSTTPLFHNFLFAFYEKSSVNEWRKKNKERSNSRMPLMRYNNADFKMNYVNCYNNFCSVLNKIDSDK